MLGVVGEAPKKLAVLAIDTADLEEIDPVCCVRKRLRPPKGIGLSGSSAK
jgi:hypothetical protein